MLLLPWSLFIRSLSLYASLAFGLLSISETLDVSLSFSDFSSPVHNLGLNADLNHNDDNASRRQLPSYIHYQILLVYSCQSLLYSLVLSTRLVSGPDSHLTFSLENFFLIDSRCFLIWFLFFQSSPLCFNSSLSFLLFQFFCILSLFSL